MKARLFVSTVLSIVAGMLLPWLLWYHQVTFAEHAARFQIESLDWLVVAGGSILWTAVVFGSFLVLLPAVKTNKSYAVLYLFVDVIVILIGLMIARNSLLSAPVALMIGYSTMLVPALYIAIVYNRRITKSIPSPTEVPSESRISG